ncbi:hypothetical protein PYCCODRAFT_872161 [Trametes coccinea BRFM310]|uniref:Uncharacterized protein n=1 Tax=Trametes coccinea (strain BRFM310) TaxID=1353009 RepID=A0A1Y2IGY9_TRAC3|nr:hypothetical protein PYCCODRAFT_872161 [Trametes coccinea BRFM310]
MDPVRASDRTSPSKSGYPPRHLPLRMPYTTPFLLTKALARHGKGLALFGALAVCQRTRSSRGRARALVLSAARQPTHSVAAPALIGRSPFEGAHPQASRTPTIANETSPFRALVLPDHLCPACTAFPRPQPPPLSALRRRLVLLQSAQLSHLPSPACSRFQTPHCMYCTVLYCTVLPRYPASATASLRSHRGLAALSLFPALPVRTYPIPAQRPIQDVPRLATL